MPEKLLHTNKLNAHYGDFQALFGLDIELMQGEVVAIIGANGAGKSTLMRSIAGLCKNDTSQIIYRETDISALRADRIAHLGIALVPEGRQLFASLSVEENLKIGARTKRPGKWQLSSVYQLFPVLQERRLVPATELSGGQQQMVAIGRALMANPDLILFDEISLGLAPIIIKTIYQALPGIVDGGISAMIVEQDIQKALAVSSRFYCLQEGKVALTGDSRDAQRDDISRAYFGVEQDGVNP
ncbi:ABC transporter ATP-binding protein [Granulosicoccus sp.]|nr:ABC transporter ATP-binding protein [Granulosicoccus sp.]